MSRGGNVVGVLLWGSGCNLAMAAESEASDEQVTWAREVLLAQLQHSGPTKEDLAKALLPLGTAGLSMLESSSSRPFSANSRPLWQHDHGTASKRGKGSAGNSGVPGAADYGGVGAGVGLRSGGASSGNSYRDWSSVAEHATTFPWPPAAPTRSTRSAEVLFSAASSVQNRRAMKDAYSNALKGNALRERTDSQLHNANPLRGDRPSLAKAKRDEE